MAGLSAHWGGGGSVPPLQLTFHLLRVADMLDEGCTSVQDGFVLHPVEQEVEERR